MTIRRSIRPSWYAGISTCLPVPRRKAASRTICCTPGLVSWIGLVAQLREHGIAVVGGLREGLSAIDRLARLTSRTNS